MLIGHRKEFVSWRFERFAHSLRQTTKTQKFSLESLKPVYSRSLPKQTNKQTNKKQNKSQEIGLQDKDGKLLCPGFDFSFIRLSDD